MRYRGFAGEARPELFSRWISIGAFAPLARGHSAVNTRDSEPWAYGEEVEAVSRSYLKLRYRLLPYLYSAFYESTRNGMPVARSLAIDFTHDEKVYDPVFQNQYLFGDAILVAPVESDREISKVYLPEGTWYDLYTGRRERGGREIYVDTPMERLPVFVKGGAIVPMQEPGEHTGEVVDDVLQIHVFHGARGSCEYYEDDGVSYGYEKGQFLKRRIILDKGSLIFGKAEGSFESRFGRVKVCFHGFGALGKVRVSGKRAALREEVFRCCDKTASFDPLDSEDRDPYGEVEVQTVEFGQRRGKITVSW